MTGLSVFIQGMGNTQYWYLCVCTRLGEYTILVSLCLFKVRGIHMIGLSRSVQGKENTHS